MSSNRGGIMPIIILGILFFIFGFVTWLNGSLIPYLKIACELTAAQALLVTSAFYISYFVMALPMARVLRATGFKNGMMVGLLGWWVIRVASEATTVSKSGLRGQACPPLPETVLAEQAAEKAAAKAAAPVVNRGRRASRRASLLLISGAVLAGGTAAYFFRTEKRDLGYAGVGAALGMGVGGIAAFALSFRF